MLKPLLLTVPEDDMNKSEFWTKSKARLQRVSEQHTAPVNWLFLPGGPGLGSQSLSKLIELLSLPGNIWRLDLPGDGSNTFSNVEHHFSNWPDGLLEAAQSLDNVILVAHSTGGMLTLASPELEKHLKGLILMNSAPNSGWQRGFMEYVQEHPLPQSAAELQQAYEANPSNELLRELTIMGAPYVSTSKSIEEVKHMLANLPFNFKSHRWAERNFDTTYQAKWVPQQIPTLIFSGELDPITPLVLFTQSAAFHRDNIRLREIQNASHFPWFDNPEQIQGVFADYCEWINV